MGPARRVILGGLDLHNSIERLPRMAPRKRPVSTGPLSERLLKLQLETGVAEPYKITSDLSVEPLTKTRGTALNEAAMRLGILQSLLSHAISQSIPRPTRPDYNAPADEHDAYAKAVEEWTAEVERHDETTNAIAGKIGEAELDYNRAFFGDAYDDVMAFFESQPQKLWDAFVVDIKREFLPPQPDNGVCPTCGHADAETAGKVPESLI